MMTEFKGVYPALMTPFDAGETWSERRFAGWCA